MTFIWPSLSWTSFSCVFLFMRLFLQQVVNSHLVCDLTIRQPGFNLPRQQWSLLNHFRTELGHCDTCRRKWRLPDTDLCPCGETQPMSHNRTAFFWIKPNSVWTESEFFEKPNRNWTKIEKFISHIITLAKCLFWLGLYMCLQGRVYNVCVCVSVYSWLHRDAVQPCLQGRVYNVYMCVCVQLTTSWCSSVMSPRTCLQCVYVCLCAVDYIVMQFGRVSKDVFTMCICVSVCSWLHRDAVWPCLQGRVYNVYMCVCVQLTTSWCSSAVSPRTCLQCRGVSQTDSVLRVFGAIL